MSDEFTNWHAVKCSHQMAILLFVLNKLEHSYLKVWSLPCSKLNICLKFKFQNANKSAFSFGEK